MLYIAEIAGLPCRESNRIGIDKAFVSIKDVKRGIKVQRVALSTDRHLEWPSPTTTKQYKPDFSKNLKPMSTCASHQITAERHIFSCSINRGAKLQNSIMKRSYIFKRHGLAPVRARTAEYQKDNGRTEGDNMPGKWKSIDKSGKTIIAP